MSNRFARLVVAAGIVLAVAGCSQQTRFYLQEEQKNGAHFASWNHMGYSLHRATPQATTKQDVALAGQEKWFGDVVKVAPIQ